MTNGGLLQFLQMLQQPPQVQPGPQVQRGPFFPSMVGANLLGPFGNVGPGSMPPPQDQNRPMTWGLEDVLGRRSDAMKDPGRIGGAEYGDQQRQKVQDYEINILQRLFGRGMGGEI